MKTYKQLVKEVAIITSYTAGKGRKVTIQKVDGKVKGFINNEEVDTFSSVKEAVESINDFIRVLEGE